MMPLTQLSFCLLATLLAGVLPSPLAAQQWPTRTIRIVTGTPAGGSPDFVRRLLGEKLSERLGQEVVIVNSATTGGAAPNALAKAQPDRQVVSRLPGDISARASVAEPL